MAADLLNELAAQGALPERYLILEVSADLRERQRALLQRTCAGARWRASSGSIACRRNSAASCSRTKCWMRCRCSAFAFAATQVNSLGVTWQLGRLDWSEMRADADARSGGAAHRGEHRRAFAGWLHVGDQSAARAVDRRRRGGAARRRGVVHRLRIAAASVLPQRAAARARCCATSAIASTTIR